MKPKGKHPQSCAMNVKEPLCFVTCAIPPISGADGRRRLGLRCLRLPGTSQCQTRCWMRAQPRRKRLCRLDPDDWEALFARWYPTAVRGSNGAALIFLNIYMVSVFFSPSVTIFFSNQSPFQSVLPCLHSKLFTHTALSCVWLCCVIFCPFLRSNID